MLALRTGVQVFIFETLWEIPCAIMWAAGSCNPPWRQANVAEEILDLAAREKWMSQIFRGTTLRSGSDCKG